MNGWVLASLILAALIVVIHIFMWADDGGSDPYCRGFFKGLLGMKKL